MPKQATVVPSSTKLSAEEFTHRAITNLRKPEKSKGIHSVFSGFNEAFRTYYGEGSDPIAAVKKLEKEGKVQTHFARKGVMIFLPGEAPEKSASSEKTLNAILG